MTIIRKVLYPILNGGALYAVGREIVATNTEPLDKGEDVVAIVTHRKRREAPLRLYMAKKVIDNTHTYALRYLKNLYWKSSR